MINLFLVKSLTVQRSFIHVLMYVTIPNVNKLFHPFWIMIVYSRVILIKLMPL